MSQSHLQQFTEATANYITSCLLSPICDWIKKHPNEEVTPEKLIKVLELPTAKKAVSTPQPLAPKRTRRTTPTSNRKQCRWVFKSGAREGEQCTGLAQEGSDYCSACKNKKGAGGTGRSSKPKTKGLTPKEEPEDEKEMVAKQFGQSSEGEELFIFEENGYVLVERDGDFMVIGISDDGKTMRKLSATEKTKAIRLGLEHLDGINM